MSHELSQENPSLEKIINKKFTLPRQNPCTKQHVSVFACLIFEYGISADKKIQKKYFFYLRIFYEKNKRTRKRVVWCNGSNAEA